MRRSGKRKSRTGLRVKVQTVKYGAALVAVTSLFIAGVLFYDNFMNSEDSHASTGQYPGWTIPDPGSNTAEIPPQDPEKYVTKNVPLIEVTPNPADKETTLKFTNPEGIPHRLDLFDSEGSLLRTYRNIHEDFVVIERMDLPNGIYSYVLRGEGNTFAGRIKFIYKFS